MKSFEKIKELHMKKQGFFFKKRVSSNLPVDRI